MTDDLDNCGHLAQCDNCDRVADLDDMWDCAGQPVFLPGWLHCEDCWATCGSCKDEAAKERQAEERADIRRFGP